MNKREWLEINVGRDFVVGFDELGIDFYYMAMHDNGMDLYDADRYAWLNVLFGYDIGADHALGITNWYYENDMEVLELVGGLECKEEMMRVTDELGYNLNYSYWVLDEPDYVTYKYMATPKIKKLIDKMFDNGYSINDVCGCICGLYHDNLIDDAQEDELYIYADPDDIMEIAPFEAWCVFEDDNPLDYTKEI